VFPSKELLLKAVLEDIREEVSEVFRAAEIDAGLDHAIRRGLENYWEKLVINDPASALMRHELFVYALRTHGLESLARWQIEGYSRIVAEWCQQAANNAGEICAVPFDTLGRVLVGGVIGITLQYLSDRDQTRSRRDLQALIEMLIRLAAIRPAPNPPAG
jgi:AcrR family transcriptional regulator